MIRACMFAMVLGASPVFAHVPLTLDTHVDIPDAYMREPRANRLASVDTIVDQVVERYHLPGIAVGIIEDGKVTHLVTRGETRVGSGQPITPKTVFKIASNSKAMTASILARQVDAGKLRWDDPVIKHLPSFRMYDPWVTSHMQVGDLLVHNSGLPEGGGDLMLWPDPNLFTRADILSGLGHIKPAYGFRSGYAYDNLLYVVAGEVAAAVGRASYEELARSEIFEPLGLSGCRVGEWSIDDAGSVAQPHRRSGNGDGNALTDVDPPMIPSVTSAAAGGIRCSLDDMMTWAINWLAPDPGQLQWLSASQRAEMWKPRTPMPVSSRRRAWDNTHYYAYGYGWRFADADGAWTVSHTGTLNGMYSVVSLLPDTRSGFVVLINGEADDARMVLTEVLLKRFTAPSAGRTVAEVADEIAAEASKSGDKAKIRPIAAARARTPAVLPAERLGVYRDPWFGDVLICPGQGGTRFTSAKSPQLSGRVLSSGDKLVVDWDEDAVDAEAWIKFSPAGAGVAAGFTMSKLDPDADFSYDYEDLAFTRVRSCD